MLQAVAATIDITPPHTLSPACHGAPNIPSTGVAVPFEANVLGLRENGRTFIYVSVDWFYASPSLRERILARCAGRLDEAGLVVAASHSHTSPNTDRSKTGFSEVDSDYVSWAEDRIANQVAEILNSDSWAPSVLRFSTSACDYAIHRRRYVWRPEGFRLRRRLSIFPNPAGHCDRELRLMRIENESGGLLALIWGISCHPTVWPRFHELSSDYPGVIRQGLRARIGAEAPIIFLQGFSGDLLPPSVGRWPRVGSSKQRLLHIVVSAINGPGICGFTAKEYGKWSNMILECAWDAFLRSARADRVAGDLKFARNSIKLAALGLSAKIDELAFHTIDIGNKLKFVAISAEVCWEYAELIGRRFPDKTIWPVGCIDSVYGYLPVTGMIAEGGYEVEGFMPYFGVKGQFDANLDEIVVNSIP